MRCYVVRAEPHVHVDAHAGRELAGHVPEDVTLYLKCAGRNAIPGWPMWQLPHALQLLFTQVVRAAWAAEFDWQFWWAAARELEDMHPTIARQRNPIANAALKNDSLSPDDVKRALAANLRLKNYSTARNRRT